jgi:GDP-D-mannose 3', 5'-epimerase
MSGRRVVVAGAGGFIGGHLAANLLSSGDQVVAVDSKPVGEWHQAFPDAENLELDLREKAACDRAVQGSDAVYNLAADMGGMGFIETHRTECMLSVLINSHLLLAASEAGVARYFFASSACVYSIYKQASPEVAPLREDDAYPAMPEDGYGWEKLFGERMCRHFLEERGIETRVARYHNVYGPYGTFEGGREKAPAAICRKVAEAKLLGKDEIEIWGDGEQSRSFMFIDDCLYGTKAIMESDICEPINLGRSELVTINQLVDIVEEIAATSLRRKYDLSAPEGVRGRNSDNTMIVRNLGWEPSIPLRAGLEQTYAWIYDALAQRLTASQAASPMT